ncbi:MAG: sulfatase-like hydrolase/transferase [Pirellulales bacterium]|nr:sulfatase-like hydrolase/transferase [Pirellulales bacterium]
MNAICLVIDRLHAGYLGAYGNAWIETPAVDRLACESFVFDQALIGSPRTEGLCRAVWQGRHPLLRGQATGERALAERLAAEGVRTMLLTDEPAVADDPLAEGFAQLVEIDLPDRIETADAVERTHMARCFSELVDRLDGIPEPFLAWAHFTGMAARWDAPYAFRERWAEEDDPAPPEDAEVPRTMLDEDYDPDDLLGITHAYAGQVALLDVCLGALLEWLRESPLGSRTMLAFLSARGFPLGEHRRVGVCDEALFGELVHVPMMLRLPDGCGAAARSQALVTPADLRPTLLEYWSIDEPPAGRFDRSLLPLVRGDVETVRDRLCLGASGGETAIRAPAWYLRRADRFSLFVKPDDRWEVNDVADRCPDVVQRLDDAAAEYIARLQVGQLDGLAPLDDLLVHGPD